MYSCRRCFLWFAQISALQGFVLVYSITSQTSFEAAIKLRGEILKIKEDYPDVSSFLRFFLCLCRSFYCVSIFCFKFYLYNMLTNAYRFRSCLLATNVIWTASVWCRTRTAKLHLPSSILALSRALQRPTLMCRKFSLSWSA